MLKRTGLAILGAAAMSLVASHALAQFPPATDPTKDEQKCETAVGKATSGEVSGISKCTSKCFKDGRKTSGPYTDCTFPYAGATSVCVNDSVKGPLAKASASIGKACTDAPGKDRCPECYQAQGPNMCSQGQPRVGVVNALTGATASSVFCTEAGGNTPSKEVAKCEDAVSKNSVKFVGALNKCYAKCFTNEMGGKIAPGSCNAGTPSDPATADCVGKARTKNTDGINKACFIAPAQAPSCYTGGLSPNSGAGWTNLVEGIVNPQVGLILCGSPSGAFLQ